MVQNDAFMGKDQVLAFRSEHSKQDHHRVRHFNFQVGTVFLLSSSITSRCSGNERALLPWSFLPDTAEFN